MSQFLAIKILPKSNSHVFFQNVKNGLIIRGMKRERERTKNVKGGLKKMKLLGHSEEEKSENRVCSGSNLNLNYTETICCMLIWILAANDIISEHWSTRQTHSSDNHVHTCCSFVSYFLISEIRENYCPPELWRLPSGSFITFVWSYRMFYWMTCLSAI